MSAIPTVPLGNLNCRIVGVPQPTLVAIFCHGFGAPGDDLVPLGIELIQQSRAIREQVRFIFPEAPLSLAEQGMPDGRAWWPIDMMKLQTAVARGRFRDLRNEQPPLLPSSRDKLLSVIQHVREETGLPLSRIVMGGFSQGSMLATDVSLRLEASPAALVIWSGTLLNETEWRALAPQRAGLKVFQSHGREDMLLPFAAAQWLRDLLTESGLEVEFHPFHGGHTIPYTALGHAARLLEGLCQ